MQVLSFRRTGARFLGPVILLFVIGCASKRPPEAPSPKPRSERTAKGNVGPEADTLGLSGMSADDFPPPSEDLTMATDSLLA